MDVLVAPFAGAWIEITPKIVFPATIKSLPSRERGLKWRTGTLLSYCDSVAPFAGAWIEINVTSISALRYPVAPFAGAWIEIRIHYWPRIDRSRRSLRGSVD